MTTARKKGALEREKNGLALAARVTGCKNLLQLTDHESGWKERDGLKIKVQPVYEWCMEEQLVR